MSSTIANQPTVHTAAPAREIAAPPTPKAPPALATKPQVVAEAVTSPAREGLRQMPQGWKDPVPNMTYTPAALQDECRRHGISDTACRDEWNEMVDSRAHWNEEARNYKPAPPVKDSGGPAVIALTAAIRARDLLARAGVVK